MSVQILGDEGNSLPQLKVTQKEDNACVITIGPLPRGFGDTLGQPLRRVMLACLAGAKIVDVDIEGVSQMFSTIDGVLPGVEQILQNLKEVVVDCNMSEDEMLDLSKYDVQDVLVNKEGPCTITAGDLEFTGGARVLNPDLVIAELSEGAKFVMRGTVEAGRGYVPATTRSSQRETDKIGCMMLDASFSPVRLVHYSVENARVETRPT